MSPALAKRELSPAKVEQKINKYDSALVKPKFITDMASLSKGGARGIFITGTDTGIGKTVCCGLLARYLADRGHRVITQKWVQTGNKDFSLDTNLHLKLMKRRKKEIKDYLSYVAPYTFKFAASPHLAASLEKKKVQVAKIKQSFKVLAQRFDFVIVEGIGGALVPLNRKKLLLDLVKELNLPLLIVAGNKLGGN